MAPQFPLQALLGYDDPTALTTERISPADIFNPLRVGANLNASEIWRFGGGRISLGGRLVGGRQNYLVPQYPAPVFPDNLDGLHNWMTTPEGDGCALVTPFDDAADFTWIIVFRKVTPATFTNLLGNYTNALADGGWELYATSAGVWTVNTRGMSTPAAAVPWPAGVADGAFVALGIAQTTTTRTILARGGTPLVSTNAAKVNRLISNNSATNQAIRRKVALGNQYYTAGTGHAIDVKALEAFPSALSATALAAALENTAAGCLSEGVPVYPQAA